MAMNNWKLKKMKKGQRASRTSSGRARSYQAFPPEEGWKGGAPEQNGYRKGRG
jgi:hypothetical protein